MATIASRQLNMATTNTLVVAKRNEALHSGGLGEQRDARRALNEHRDRGHLAELHERAAASEISKQEKADEDIYAQQEEEDDEQGQGWDSDNDERAPPSQSDDGWISNTDTVQSTPAKKQDDSEKKPWWSADVSCWKPEWTNFLLCRKPADEKDLVYVLDPDDPQFGERVRKGMKARKPWPQPFKCIFSTRARLFRMLDDPSSSYVARFVTVISLFFIVFSTVTFILETMPEFHRKNEDVWFGFEVVTVAFFTVEYAARLLTCPNPIRFVVQPMNVIDLIAIAPFYIDLLVSAIEGSGGGSSVFRVFRTVRLVRVFRIFKVSKYSSSIQIFFKTVQRGANALGLLLMYLLIACTVFASLAYFAERGTWDENTRKYYINGEVSKFQSIPESFWWAVTTVTATGYGDFVPLTFWGRLVAVGAMITGLLVLSFPVSIIGATFTDLWFEKTLKQGIKKSTLHKPWIEDDPMEVFFFNLVTKMNDVEIAQMAFEDLMEKTMQRVRHSRRLRLYIKRSGQPKTTHMIYAMLYDVSEHMQMLQESLNHTRLLLNSVVWKPQPVGSTTTCEVDVLKSRPSKAKTPHHSLMIEKKNMWTMMKNALIIAKKPTNEEEEEEIESAPPDKSLQDFVKIMVRGSKFKDALEDPKAAAGNETTSGDSRGQPEEESPDSKEHGDSKVAGETAAEDSRHHIGLWKKAGAGSLELVGDVRRLGSVARTSSFLANNKKQTSITAVIDIIAAMKSMEDADSQSAESSHRSFSLSTVTAASPGGVASTSLTMPTTPNLSILGSGSLTPATTTHSGFATPATGGGGDTRVEEPSDPTDPEPFSSSTEDVRGDGDVTVT